MRVLTGMFFALCFVLGKAGGCDPLPAATDELSGRIQVECDKKRGHLIYQNSTGGLAVVPNGCK
jgi:hypothetical protein